MKTDFIESEDLAAVNSELVKHLSEKLFVMLDEMGARYPTKDPDWNAGKEKEYLERVVNSRLPNLEKQRMNFLSKDFDPKNNWWGSFITND